MTMTFSVGASLGSSLCRPFEWEEWDGGGCRELEEIHVPMDNRPSARIRRARMVGTTIGFQELNEKWPCSKPDGGKTKRSTHINYTLLEIDTVRTKLVEFSDKVVCLIF